MTMQKAHATFNNPGEKTITVFSPDYPSINNQRITPNSQITFTLEVPYTLKLHVMPLVNLDSTYGLHVSLVDEDF